MTYDVPVPANEIERVAEIQELCLLDPLPDPVFDGIVKLAAELFKVPIALVSIVDTNRQWFRARVGLAIQETPREQSFCTYAILSDKPFVVPDTLQDPRFQNNPLVTGEPYIRFYTGVPLLTQNGLGLGSLCIIDTKPRPPLNTHEIECLTWLADLVMERIDSVRKINFIDLPTGLYNRSRLEEDVARHFALSDNPITLVAVDIAAPRTLNEIVKALGYTFSTQFMLVIKERLQALLPAHFELYKISSTRLAFMLTNHAETKAEALYDRIVQAFEAPLVCNGIPLQTQIGIGVLPLAEERFRQTDWIRSLVSVADDARENRDGWTIYNPHRDQAQQRAFNLLNALTIALQSDDQLSLHYQPRLSLTTHTCHAVEALIRWTHPTLGKIGPGEFIPLAEKTFLIRSVSLWVLRQAIRQAAEWYRQGLNLKVAINVSAADLDDTQFVDTLIAHLQEHDLPICYVEIEFTESAVIRSAEQVKQQLERLHALGIEIAIDDFGTGYSNWAYLRDTPASTVKLDRSFLRHLSQVEKDRRIVKAMIHLAKEMNYRIVAEGIETEDIYSLMRDWGCDEGQGYLMAYPMPATEIPRWLQTKPPTY
ncbi:EAL domain-containing protein (putative c-di-GMP-specific phosphodiesterase class I) [Pseudomonas duriflava]|uniref:EAL domain-containing protein (Putative c-di-GMP-specific phosphodiesterase class I) n=1 Tax=Pseudomonas duriflava TaxID=459528 RepID=A0A562QI55_9PSED|nr:sensor domain-containing phosphodiesterase [Pseudomonas duriflava]TWI55736.1 EAL domain-containing protein (putative c-di-GMP-specific phosphodiesterase class I) [Pseudomonas duriflava]